MIFDEIDAKYIFPNIVAEKLINEANHLCLTSRPWSIAELGLTGRDYDWLIEWYKNLSPDQLSNPLESKSRIPVAGESNPQNYVIGLVLLTLFAEIVRREGSGEGEVWQAIFSKIGDDAASSALFSENGQPKYEIKKAIEGTANLFNLRNVFGRTGVQAWYDSIRLQFGFTFNGLQKKLPLWLSGIAWTLPIQTMMNDVSQKSESFIASFMAMRNYRLGNIKSTN